MKVRREQGRKGETKEGYEGVGRGVGCGREEGKATIQEGCRYKGGSRRECLPIIEDTRRLSLQYHMHSTATAYPEHDLTQCSHHSCFLHRQSVCQAPGEHNAPRHLYARVHHRPMGEKSSCLMAARHAVQTARCNTTCRCPLCKANASQRGVVPNPTPHRPLQRQRAELQLQLDLCVGRPDDRLARVRARRAHTHDTLFCLLMSAFASTGSLQPLCFIIRWRGGVLAVTSF